MKKRGNTQHNIRAQVSIEFLIVVGFAFLMTIPLFILFYRQSETINTEVTASQIDKVASEMRDAADEVYYLGEPSKKTITVYIPKGVQSIDLVNNSIIFLVDGPGRDYEVVKWTAGNFSVSSSINTFKGIHHISAESLGNEVVMSE